jgi:hypothetical protein
MNRYPAEVLDNNDNWEPSATAIPFGPYLAAGALICMLAGGSIQHGLKSYWDNATGATPRAAFEHSGRTPRSLVQGGQTPFYVEQRARISSLLPRDGLVKECL